MPRQQIQHPVFHEGDKQMKQCIGCNFIMPVEMFSFRKQTVRRLLRPVARCKQCRSKYQKEHDSKNKEDIARRDKLRRIKNSEMISIRRKAAYMRRTPEEIEEKRVYMRTYIRERLRRDIPFRLLSKARNRLWYVAKGTAKAGRTVELLGCTPEELKIHIEKQFKPGWTWADWGPVFEIDHIIPCSKFDMTDPEQQKQCFHFTNLQPLLKAVNRSKWNKLIAA